jgi:hypothetical protein
MKPNWVHDCTGQSACCTLLCVVGKLDIYYAHAIRAYVVRSSNEATKNFYSVQKLRNAAEAEPDKYPGLLAAIDMGGIN